MTQQFHFWVFIQRKWKHSLENYLYPHVYSRLLTIPRHGNNLCPRDNWKKILWCYNTHNRILFSHKKRNSDIFDKVNASWGHYVKLNKSEKNRYYMFLVHLQKKNLTKKDYICVSQRWRGEVIGRGKGDGRAKGISFWWQDE